MVIRRLFPVLCAVMLLSILASCTPAATTSVAPGPTSTPVTQGPSGGEAQKVLRVWITWGDNPAQIQSLFNKFGDANNVKVEVTAPVEDDKVIAALTGSEPPDILVLGGPDNVGSWKQEGLVTELDDLIQSSGIDLKDIYEAPLNQCKYSGKLYCLPWGTDVYALFWNKDLYEEAGLDPEKPPMTMEELATFADKLTKKDDNGNITQVGFIPDFSWSHDDLYVRNYGGFWYSEDGTKVTLSSQPMIDMYKWQQQFYTKYGADQVLKFTSALGGYMSPDQGFYAGKIAMMVDGEWQVGPNFIKKFKPELNYGVAPFPPPSDHPERKNTAVVAGTVALIPAGAKDKGASMKLLAWMMSPEIVAEEMYANFNLPTSKKAAQDPRFLENEKFKIFMDLMSNSNATTVILTPINSQVNDQIGQIDEQVLHTGADPLPLCQEADQKLQPELEKVQNK